MVPTTPPSSSPPVPKEDFHEPHFNDHKHIGMLSTISWGAWNNNRKISLMLNDVARLLSHHNVSLSDHSHEMMEGFSTGFQYP